MNFVQVKMNGRNMRLLVDTGASVSIVKSCVLLNERVNELDNIKISGLVGETVSNGSAILRMEFGNMCLDRKFYVIDEFVDDLDGILGSDFLEDNKATINFENFTLNFWLLNKHIKIKLNSKDEILTKIPSRCEIVRYFRVNVKNECVVRPQELCEGVFVAACIVKPENGVIPVRMLNTKETDVILKNFIPVTEDLNEYEVAKFESDKFSAERVKKLISILKFDELNSEERPSIENLCIKFADVFHLEGDQLNPSKIYQQNIQLIPNAKPVYVKPYRLPFAQKEEIEKQIKKLIKDEIIEESRSEWSSPILLVPKKTMNGMKNWRIVVDYRLLNKQIADEKFPLPNIHDILDSLSQAVYFSHLDLSQGYYQLELDENSRKYTAFTTSNGQYQMTRLPMGLKISPSAFSRAMTIAMSGLNYENCFIYLDDIVVFGRNLMEHNQNLLKVFNRLRSFNLKLNPSKCEFLKKQLLYLGHIISKDGIAPDPQKIEVLKAYPVPKNADEVKRFVAFSNYYRRHIQNFAEIVKPLNSLTKKYAQFLWTSECQKAFDTLISKFTTAPILQYPDFSKEGFFILRTDASAFALGAVLSNADDKPVAYASRTLKPAEVNYPVIEKELLAIVWACKHFRPYLFGKKFEILTDHRPLIYLFGMTNPSSRLTKFRLALEEFDFKITYVKGKDNATADALSRITIDSNDLKKLQNQSIFVTTRAMTGKKITDQDVLNNSEDKEDRPQIMEILKKPKNGIELICVTKIDKRIFNKNDIVKTKKGYAVYVPGKSEMYLQLDTRSTLTQDETLRDLVKLCKLSKINELIIIKNRCTSNRFHEIIQFLLNNSVLKQACTQLKINIVKSAEIINDDASKEIILHDFHILPSGGHSGVNRMFNNVKKYFFWSGLKKDIEAFVSKCISCQKNKHKKHVKEPMCITSTASSGFEKIYLDTVGPLPKDDAGNVYILTLQCELTKYVEAYSVPNKETSTIARAFVENFVLRYGIPKEIASDKGTEFVSSVMDEVAQILGINKIVSTPYHHQSIGSLENTHKSLGTFLRIQAQENTRSWSSWVPYWCFSYNTSMHTETQYTPYELIFGKVCNLPSNILTDTVDPIYTVDNYAKELKFRLQIANKEVKSTLLEKKEKRKNKYDSYLNPVNYNIGDLVLLKNNPENKLQPLYKGPYEVMKVENPNVILNIKNKEYVIHKNLTIPFHN